MKKLLFSIPIVCILTIQPSRFVSGQVAPSISTSTEGDFGYGNNDCDSSLVFLGEKGNKIDLSNAALDGNLEKVKQLLSKGASVNFQGEDKGGITPLMSAAEAGGQCYDSNEKRFEKHDDYVQIVKLLLEKGADANAEDNAGPYTPLHVTPLMYAADGRSETIIKLLLSSKAKTGKKDSDRRTVLMRVSRWGSSNVVELLIGKGESVNTRNKLGYTALMAASLNSVDVTKDLISTGAKANERTKAGATALMMAPYATRPKEYSPDKFTSARVPSYYTEFAEDRAKSIIMLLLSNGADINAQAKSGATPLLQAVRVGSPSVVELLLQKGANPNLGQPLILAKRLTDTFRTSERQQIVEFLENAGAKS